MLTLRILVALIILISCAISDIRNHEINILILVLGIIVVILHGNKLHFNGAIPGLVLLVISKVTSGIGEGDGYIFIFAGLLFGVTALVYIMVISFMLSGMYALAAKFIKKQDNTFSFAFAPFILIGFVIYAFVGIKGIRI